MRKFMLATDADLEKLRFPLWMQPKIDGVRGGHLNDEFTGRSLKAPGNTYVTEFFGNVLFAGIDGEMAANHECHHDLCRLTTSAMSTHEGEPWLLWHAFDYVTPETEGLEYELRYEALSKHISYLRSLHPGLGAHIKIVPYKVAYCIEDVKKEEDRLCKLGYEGLILRDPKGKNKQGRSTIREMGLLRIKRFEIEEAVVDGIEEGQSNGNEATRDARGYIERSTHKENMVPNGMVGVLLCTIAKTKQKARISPGRMSHDFRRAAFLDPTLIVKKTIKFQSFKHGVKDAPRQATFQCIRDEMDIGLDA